MNRPDKTAETLNNQKQSTASNGIKKKLLWTILFIVIAVASISAVIMGTKGFSAENFLGYISTLSPIWIAVALMCMFGYIFFEGAAITTICRAFGYKCTNRDGFLYSASDIYFSAITPSATGGQPACAYFMMRDGIPGTLTTALLFLNLAMYALSIVVIGLICLIFHPELLFCFSPVSRALIYFGFAAQIGLCAVFLLLIKNEKLLHKICLGALRFLGRIHVVRHLDQRLEKLEKSMVEYRECVALLRGRFWLSMKVFLCNLIQRGLLIAITVFTFLSGGGDASKCIDIYALQSYVVIGTNVLPIPGAMGVTDYFLLDAFEDVMTSSEAVNLELLSRSVAFYFCVIVCGASVLIKFLIQRKARKKS